MPYIFAAPLRRVSIRLALAILVALLATSLAVRPASASLTTTIPYTGQLLNESSPVTGLYDFHFRLYNAATGGTQVGPIVTMNSVPVADGVFYVELDFGSVFTGQTLYLQTAYGLHPATTLTTQPTRKLIAFSGESDYAAASGVSASTQALQGVAVSTTLPMTGQVLTYSGSQWQAKALPAVATYKSGPGLSLSNDVFSIPTSGVTGSMLSLPLTVTANVGESAVFVSNTASNAIGAVSTSGSAVIGQNAAENIGYLGDSAGHGVLGISADGNATGFLGGIDPLDQSDTGVYGSATAPNDYGVLGNAPGENGFGVFGYAAGEFGAGVYGQSTGATGIGVTGSTFGDNSVGVYATAAGNQSIGGYFSGGTNGLAAEFNGDVTIFGTLSATTKDFKIDDPLDPANKVLNHSCIESDEMTNIYSGNVVTDARGDAIVRMPNWFGALNRDFRYQLTVIGQFAQAIVSSEIRNNQFAIKTDKPGVKVSWQVTGVRQDAYAGAHPLVVEEDKSDDERGLYLNPTEQGQPNELGIGYAKQHRLHPK